MPAYDVAVLVAGSAGEMVATTPAKAGPSVLVVESHLVGGECPYLACMRSKVLLRDLQRSRDWSAAVRRRDEVARHRDDSDAARALEEAGSTLVRGRGPISGPGELVVDGTAYAGHTSSSPPAYTDPMVYGVGLTPTAPPGRSAPPPSTSRTRRGAPSTTAPAGGRALRQPPRRAGRVRLQWDRPSTSGWRRSHWRSVRRCRSQYSLAWCVSDLRRGADGAAGRARRPGPRRQTVTEHPPHLEAPEADATEQADDVGPGLRDPRTALPAEADEADVAEQDAVVETDDEEYR